MDKVNCGYCWPDWEAAAPLAFQARLGRSGACPGELVAGLAGWAGGLGWWAGGGLGWWAEQVAGWWAWVMGRASRLCWWSKFKKC